MSEINRLYYAIQRIENKSVATMGYADWARLVRSDGKLTELEALPEAINNPNLEASTLVAVASGIAVVQPGMDVLRYDPRDAPYIVNLDHYTIIENLHCHEIYEEALQVAKISDTPRLRFELQNNIYVIKEAPGDNHWLEDFPEYIWQAKRKT